MGETEFPTTLGPTYSRELPLGPLAVEEIEGSQPIYSDSQLQLYDILYRKIIGMDIHSIINDKSNKINENMPKETFPNFPVPKNYPDLAQYVESTKVWKEKFENVSTSVLLPHIIISKVLAPLPPSEIIPSTPQYRNFDPTKNPLTSKNHHQLMNIILASKEVNDEIPLTEQIHNRKKVMISHQICSSEQWISQLIPQEPNLLLYENYDEYEEAYKRWYEVTLNSIKVPLINVQDLGEIISIPANNEDKCSSNDAELIKYLDKMENMEKSQKFLNNQMSWVENVMPDSVKSWTKDKYKFEYDDDSKVFIHEFSAAVFGVDSNEFIRDYYLYGDYKLNTEGSIKRPFKFLDYYTTEDSKILIEKFFQNFNGNERDFVRIVNMNFDFYTFHSFENKIYKDSKLIDIIAKNVNQNTLPLLYSLGRTSGCHSIRAACVLNSFAKTENGMEFVKHMFNSNNLDQMYLFLTIASAQCNENIYIMPPPSEPQGLKLMLWRHMYSAMMLTLPIATASASFECLMLGIARESLMRVITALKAPGKVLEVWESLENLTACVNSQSEALLKALIHPEIIQRIVNLCSYEEGRNVISRLVYGSTGSWSTAIMQSRLDFTSIVDQPDIASASLFAQLIDVYQVDMRRLNLKADQKRSSEMASFVLANFKPDLFPVLQSLLSVFVDKTISSNNCNDEKVTDMARLLLSLFESGQLYLRGATSMIELTLRFKGVPALVASHVSFVNALADIIVNMTDVKGVRAAWRILRCCASSPEAARSILRSSLFTKRVGELLESESALVGRKFAELISLLAQKGDSVVRTEADITLSPHIGRLAGFIKNATRRFRDFPGAQQSIERMTDVILRIYRNDSGDSSQKLHTLSVYLDSFGYGQRKSSIGK